MMEPVFKTYSAIVKSLPDDEIEGFFNVAEVDRYDEYLEPSAFLKHLDKFRKNNVVLWAHDYSQPPIGKVVDIGVTENGLRGRVKLATEANPTAKTIRDLIKQGFGPNSFSIGFIPHAYDEDYELPDGQKVKKRYTEVEVIELSMVNVPASPSSQITARDFKGMETAFCIKGTQLSGGDAVEAGELLEFLVREIEGEEIIRKPEETGKHAKEFEMTAEGLREALEILLPRFLPKLDEKIEARLDRARGVIKFPE